MERLVAARVITPAGVLEPGEVVLEADRIAAVGPARGPAPDRTLAPGFVDLQVNGHGAVDVASAEGADWDELDRLLLQQGVTAWCPTLPSMETDRYPAALARITAAAGRPDTPAVLGVHVEGPFLARERAGAHDPAHLRPVDPHWLDRLDGPLRIVTLAPELPGALDLVRRLTDRGVVVALGHTAAPADIVRAAAGAGARLVTHLFNTMPAFHHRSPGPAGAALVDDRLTVSLIADLVHVHATALALAVRVKGPGRSVLVTDAVAWRLGRFGDRPVEMDGAPRLADSTIAGSSLTMDQAVRNVVHTAGISLADAVAMASATPAALLGEETRGRLAPGCRADVVALDPSLQVEAVWLGGRRRFG